MTTSETVNQRVLRRSRTDRVGAGVAGGLGDYFGVDPVLFRVLFATAAFFGGAGILAYLLAWAAIPEAGTVRAPIDGWVRGLRRRRIPVWVVAVAAAAVLWLVAFSWWAPGPFFPVGVVVVLLVVFFGRRELRSAAEPSPVPVDLTKSQATATATTATATTATPTDAPAPTEPLGWTQDMRSWIEDSRARRRDRRRRAMPVRLAILAALLVAYTVLGIIDAVSGIQLQVYFWTTLVLVVAGLLVGAATRRTPFGVAPLLVPAIVGAIAFAGSHASLHDGIGQREWRATGSSFAQYRLAFGQGILDLRSLPVPTTPQTIDITLGAGQVKVLAPTSLNLSVLANIHLGQLDVDGSNTGETHGGVGLTRIVDPPTGATGAPVTVDVHVADGNITVEHQ